MTIFELTIFWVKIAPTYYWLMYILWFVAWYLLLKQRKIVSEKHLDDLIFYIFLWVIFWARLGFVLFYNFSYYLENPIDIIKIWEWWMSFHGWVIWVIIAMFAFSKKFKFSFLKVADQVTLALPIWLWLWRIWNYLNKELLWYEWYNWIFAVEKDWIFYFPSPLLEALLEWFVLFLILNLIYVYKKNLKPWQIGSLFLVFYSIFRIFVEIFFRLPDKNIWYIFSYFTMWELLSLPMLLFWIYYYFRLKIKTK